jgi:hypothetical protein
MGILFRKFDEIGCNLIIQRLRRVLYMECIFYVKNVTCPRNMDPLKSSSLIKISPSIIIFIAVKFQA